MGRKNNVEIAGYVSGFIKAKNVTSFYQLQSPEERVQFLYKTEGYFPILQTLRREARESKKDGEKNKAMASALREAGNKAFCKGDDATALDCYNQAVMLAPCDPLSGQGEDLALCVANRSAVMFRQQKYNLCLTDVELAEKSGYPGHLRYKLLQRQGNCLAEMFRYQEAEQAYNETIKALESSNLKDDPKKKISKEIRDAIRDVKEKNGLEKAINQMLKETTKHSTEEPSFERNEKYPSLAECVTIKHDVVQGRHAIATRDIKVGEYLALEEPITFSLYQELLLSNCLNCCRPVIIPVPCFKCARVLFCSDKCRVSAWSMFHRWECQSGELLTCKSYRDLINVYRLIVRRPLTFYSEKKALFEEQCPLWGAALTQNKKLLRNIDDSDDESDDDDEFGSASSLPQDIENPDWPESFRPYLSDDLVNAFNLESHLDQAMSDDEMAISAMSAMLIFFLRKNGYFGAISIKETSLSDCEILVGKIIYHIIAICQYNTHQIQQAEWWEASKEGVQIGSVGSCINVTLALFNHSCYPNAIRCNIGNRTLMVATQNIQKGSEIWDSYSTLFQDESRFKRQGHLSENYLFNCRCQACRDDWPTYESITRAKAQPGVKLKQVEDIKKLYASVASLTHKEMQTGNFDQVIRMWCTFYDDLEKVVVPPHKCYLRVAYQIFDCIWLKFGNKLPKLNAPCYKPHNENKENQEGRK